MKTAMTLLQVLIATWIPLAAAAQTVDVVVSGTVRDPTGGVVPGVTVTLTNVERGLVRTALTDGDGFYRASPMPPGLYNLRAELNGFLPQHRLNQPLHVGTTVVVDFAFDTLTAAGEIEVARRATILETTQHTLSRLVDRDEIDSLPVIDRNFNSLASLAPGVTPTGLYGGVDISGSRDFQNGYNVDGVSAEGIGAGEQRVAYAQDWIREFQVLTSQYNAEFGRASGGVLNAITRSGSNATTVRAYGFFRNQALAAAPVFGTSKPPLQVSRVGLTAGGKLIRDRLFYFAGVESFDNNTSVIVNSSFPDRNGSVSRTSDQMLHIAKLEHLATDGGTYRLRFNGDAQRGTNADVGGISTEEHGKSTTYDATDLVGSWNRTLGRSTFNEARAAFTRTASDSRCNFAGHNPTSARYTLQYPGARLGCPGTGFGRKNTGDIQLIDNLSWTLGRHDVKAGVYGSRLQSDGDFRFVRDGIYGFERDVAFNAADPSSYPISFSQFEGRTAWDYSWWSVGLFLQDSWRAAADVTVNLGVRYDVDGAYSALNRLVRVDRGLTAVRTDRNNVAPRVGMAWTPFDNDRRTLVRAGAGLYYDENHANVATLLLFNSILVERSVIINAFNAGLNPFWPDTARAQRYLAESLARGTTPDISTLPGVVGGSPDLERDLQVPSTLQASAGLSHEFGRGWSGTMDLVVGRGRHQYVIRDVNIDRDAALAENRIVRVNRNYSFINRYASDGRFDYRALQLQGSFMPDDRHLVRFSYTLARNESNTRTALEGTGGGAFAATNPFDYDEDFGPTDNDVRHSLSVNGSATLPFGIQVSAIVSARSALPWSVTSPRQLDADPFPDRPEPRNSRRGDSHVSVDGRVSKTLAFGTRRSAMAFVEVFNATNATNLTGYVGALSAAQFGIATAASEKRRLQVGFRLTI
jgi:hypothetical protein